MKTLEDAVKEVVSDLVSSDTLFTALDVSNRVKQDFPFATHRDIRDEVRKLYSTDIQANSYGRTPITVTLKDGSNADALLYHPLSDSWDLDTKYSDQKRNALAQVKAVASVPSNPIPAPSHNATVPAAVPQSSSSARQLWSQLFGTLPSLFPRQ